MKTKRFKSLHLLAVLGIFAFLADYAWEYYNFSSKYNQTPLEIKTFDGSNQPYHPSVIFKDEGWNGYRYWMAETPYPIRALPYRDRWECPTIHVSNDGHNWISPGKLKPIDDLSDEDIGLRSYFSDPHLVLKGDSILECFYRLTTPVDDDINTLILRRISKDGVTWSDREVLIDLASDVAINTVGYVVSPAIIFENELYHMWYVDVKHPFLKNKKIRISTSPDGHKWSKFTYCILDGPDVDPWHIDVTHIDNEYQMTIYDRQNLTLWISKDGRNFKFFRQLLCPTQIKGVFYSEGLYRSSLVKDDQNFKLYFSAFDDTRRTYIGLMEGRSLEKMKPVSVNGMRISIYRFHMTFLSIWRKRIKSLFCL